MVVGVCYGQLNDVVQVCVVQIFKNFQVIMVLGCLCSFCIYVMGYMQYFGFYMVSSFLMIVNGLMQVGGLLVVGSFWNIELCCFGKIIVYFDVYDLLLWGDKSVDVFL